MIQLAVCREQTNQNLASERLDKHEKSRITAKDISLPS